MAMDINTVFDANATIHRISQWVCSEDEQHMSSELPQGQIGSNKRKKTKVNLLGILWITKQNIRLDTLEVTPTIRLNSWNTTVFSNLFDWFILLFL